MSEIKEKQREELREEFLERLKKARDERRAKLRLRRIFALSVFAAVCAAAVISVLLIKSKSIETDNIQNTVVSEPVSTKTPEPESYTEDEEEHRVVDVIAPDLQYEPQKQKSGKVIVLDAGHGLSSSSMSETERINEGYVTNNGQWGEWRHYKPGTHEDCCGSGCVGTGPGCWYPMGNGDRDTEPSITLANAVAAKGYLEQMGYTVRMTRTSAGQNPSMEKRVSYCFPNNDPSMSPDALLYVCIHSNAGGGSGTSYIGLEGTYTQPYIGADFKESSNTAGRIINSAVAKNTSLADRGVIGGEGYLILFNKCPVPIAYLEIGFYDNSSDLGILNSQTDAIGQGIANGVDEYITSVYG